MCLLETEKGRERERHDYTTIPFPPFSSRDLGHTCTCTWCEFKPLGPGLEPWLITWESSDIAITLTAGP